MSWESSQENLLDIYAVSPLGDQVNPQISGNGYKLITLDNDFLNSSESTGEWKLIVNYPTASTSATSPQLSYNYSVMTKSSLNMRLLLDKERYFTGDTMLMEARLIENNQRLRGGTVNATVQRPKSGIGKWHFKHRVSEELLQQVPSEISGEPLTLLDKKNYVLLQQKKIKLPKIITDSTVSLNDEGKDGDRYAHDGIYAGMFKDFSVPGIYKFQIAATGTAKNGEAYSRELEVQKFVDMIPDSDHTDNEAAIEEQNKDGSRIIRVSTTPFDQAKNYLGPGYTKEIKITSSAGEPFGAVEDLLYGAYQRRFKLESTDDVNPNIVITARDVQVYDGAFLKLRVPPYRWEISGHLGYSIPHGSLGNSFDGGVSAMLDLGYRYTRSWSAELLLGYHEFDKQGSGNDFYWRHTSLNGKYSYPIGIFRIYGNAGLGWYSPELGDSGMGWNAGAGVSYPFDNRISADIGYNYHRVTENDFDEFSSINLGIRYAF